MAAMLEHHGKALSRGVLLDVTRVMPIRSQRAHSTMLLDLACCCWADPGAVTNALGLHAHHKITVLTTQYAKRPAKSWRSLDVTVIDSLSMHPAPSVKHASWLTQPEHSLQHPSPASFRGRSLRDLSSRNPKKRWLVGLVSRDRAVPVPICPPA